MTGANHNATTHVHQEARGSRTDGRLMRKSGVAVVWARRKVTHASAGFKTARRSLCGN